MSTSFKIACTFGALLAHGTRVSDESLDFEDSLLGSMTMGEPDAEASEKLNKWFNNTKLPSGDQEKMDGSIDDPIWAYMKSDCFQGRYKTAAKLMMEKTCDTAVEVGGYLTPLDKFLLEQKESKGKGNAHMPSKYINIDPSMKEAKVEKKDGLTSYHLPMTLADFFHDDTKKLRKALHLKLSQDDTCSLIFGIWDPHFKGDEKAAVAKLMKNSMYAAIETSDFAKNWLQTTSKVCEEAGMTLQKSEDANCIGTPGNEEKADSQVNRHMKFFERKGSKKESKDSLSAVDISTHDKGEKAAKKESKESKDESENEEEDESENEEEESASEDEEEEESDAKASTHHKGKKTAKNE